MSDEPIEAWTNFEREYRIYHDRFYKRSLRPAEYRVFQEKPYVPLLGFERLQNEASCLRFIKSKTNIPVPDILESYDEDGSFILVTKRLTGVQMNELSPLEQSTVMKEVKDHVKTLRTLGSNRTGGPSGLVCPPQRATQYFLGRTTWQAKATAEKGFVFCHCDLSQSNIIVNPKTLKIEGIIDWEYGGFWPDFFETPNFRDPRPSGPQFRDKSENNPFLDFFQEQARSSS